MNRIVTLTMNPAVDMFLEISRLEPNRKLRCPEPLYFPGGGGINVSRAIRRLGETSMALFPAGGAAGDRLTTMMQREEIPTDCVRIRADTRQNIHVVEHAGGREYQFIVPGPALNQDEWEHCVRALDSLSPAPEYVVASGSLPPGVPVDFYARLAALALKRGFRLIVDTSGEALRQAAVKGTFLLKPNVGELADASDGGMFTESFIEGAAAAIVQTKGVGVVVVSAGAAGAILVDAGGTRRIPAPLVRIASRTGAGDSMVAGIVVALARGLPIDDAVRFGVAAGAAAVMTPGHQLCRREDAEALFALELHGKTAA
jgi:6-phosphofructokinase 2